MIKTLFKNKFLEIRTNSFILTIKKFSFSIGYYPGNSFKLFNISALDLTSAGDIFSFITLFELQITKFIIGFYWE